MEAAIKEEVKVIDFKTNVDKHKKEDEAKCWYFYGENSDKPKFIGGLLARHMIETENSFYHGGKFYFYKNGVYEPSTYEYVCKKIKAHCFDEFVKTNHLKDVYDLWKCDVEINTEEINNDPYILNLKNCYFDLNTMETIEHTPDIKSTIQLQVNYKPDLKMEDAKNFNKYLNMCIKDEGTRLLAQEMLGYTYLGVYPEKFFILKGETNTGKSTFLDIIQFIIGEKNKSAVSLQRLGDRFETVQLYNKLINICADLPQDAIKDCGIIKMLTSGGDYIHAQYKGVDGFDFKNKAKLIFSCNNLPPNESEQSEAFYKRLLLLEFPHQIADEDLDPDFKNKLQKEIDYIFLWGLEGLKRLISNRLQFTEPGKSKELREKYKKDSDPIRLFLEENCEFDKTSEEYTVANYLYINYRDWCKDLGYVPKNNSQFGSEIKNIYGTIKKQKRIKGKPNNVYIGLKYLVEEK